MIQTRIPEALLCAVSYRDGELYWSRPRKGAKLGGKVGGPDKDGYVVFCFEGRKYKAHRVIWAMFYDDPSGFEIDHINGVKSDNRITNLRLATRPQNEANKGRRSNNTSGYAGVRFCKQRKKWTASIRVHGQPRRSLGFFDNKVDAAKAYALALASIHGSAANAGVLQAAEAAA